LMGLIVAVAIVVVARNLGFAEIPA
jgi:hypothetical protein